MESENDEAEGDDNDATIGNDNDSNGRGVTNIDDLGNIWGYTSEYRDRLTGKLPVTKTWMNRKILYYSLINW